jgi:hypothetical protein
LPEWEQIVLAFDVATFLAFFHIAEIPKRNDPVELRPVTRLYEIIEIEPVFGIGRTAECIFHDRLLFLPVCGGGDYQNVNFRLLSHFKYNLMTGGAGMAQASSRGHHRRQTCAADIIERGESVPALRRAGRCQRQLRRDDVEQD